MAQGVTYDGIPLTITNVSNKDAIILVIIKGGLKPLLYYKKGDRKTYRKWNYNTITLRPQESLHIFGDNPDGFSKSDTEYINFRSSGNISVSGRVSSLSSTIRNYNYAYLFDSANVVNISEDLFSGVTLTPYCFSKLFSYNYSLRELPTNLLPFTTLSNYCYNRMFFNTGIKKIPANFLPAKNALNAYVGMFYNTSVSDIEVGAVKATTATYIASMFQNCPLENIKEGAFDTITTNLNGPFDSMFRGCKFYSAPTQLRLNGTGNYLYFNLFSYNKNLQYVGEEFFNNSLKFSPISGRVFRGTFANCTSLQSISIPYGNDTVVNKEYLFENTFSGCTSLNRVEVKFTFWTYINTLGKECPITTNWLANVSPTGTFICPKELADATDGYYDENGNFVEGVGRGASTVPEGWTIEVPIIDARDGDANAMALMAVISQQTHSDGTPWVKDSLVIMKSEAEKVTDIGTVFQCK